MKILPSIASANTLFLNTELEKLAFQKYIHFDIEDGVFLPNITFGLKTLRMMKQLFPEYEYGIHLSTVNPVSYVKDIMGIGVESICAQFESLQFPLEFINQVKKSGSQVGLALNIKTSYQDVMPFLDEVDIVLIMTAEPDQCGEVFYPPVVEKLKAFAQKNRRYKLIVDGDINEQTIKLLKNIEIDAAVVGRAIFQSLDYKRTIKVLSS